MIVALIAGATSALGAATAEYFASMGYSLALISRKEAKLNKVKTKCLAAGLQESKILCLASEIANEAQIKRFIEDIVKKLGKLDTLVICSGSVFPSETSTTPLQMYDEIMKYNVRRALFLVHLCIPHLKTFKGSIINVSSTCGAQPEPNMAFYGMSMAAVEMMTKYLGFELQSVGVRANAVICPLKVIACDEQHDMEESPEIMDKAMDAAKIIAFLALDESINGTLLPVSE